MAGDMNEADARALAKRVGLAVSASYSVVVRLDEIDRFVVDIHVKESTERGRSMWTLYDDADWDHWRERILTESDD